MTSILASGAYIPRLRLQRSAIAAAHGWFAPGLRGLGKGERAFGSWDEDAVTMAVEAARNCLEDCDRDRIDSVVLASATLPFAEGSKIERQTHLDLRDSAQSRALRRLFFASRSVTRPERLKAFQPAEIKHVAIVGGGLMGAGIAAASLAAGHRVEALEAGDAAHLLHAHIHQLGAGAREADDLAAIDIDRAEPAGGEGEGFLRADMDRLDVQQDVGGDLGPALGIGHFVLARFRAKTAQDAPAVKRRSAAVRMLCRQGPGWGIFRI